MKKSTVYFILACLMFLMAVIEGLSGFLLWLVIPGGGGRGGGESSVFWGITKNAWIDIHDWVAVAMLVLVVIHIILHWKWIVRMIKTCCRRQPS
jgi:hypothetical protein